MWCHWQKCDWCQCSATSDKSQREVVSVWACFYRYQWVDERYQEVHFEGLSNSNTALQFVALFERFYNSWKVNATVWKATCSSFTCKGHVTRYSVLCACMYVIQMMLHCAATKVEPESIFLLDDHTSFPFWVVFRSLSFSLHSKPSLTL